RTSHFKKYARWWKCRKPVYRLARAPPVAAFCPRRCPPRSTVHSQGGHRCIFMSGKGGLMVYVRLARDWTEADGARHALGAMVDVDAATLAELGAAGTVSEPADLPGGLAGAGGRLSTGGGGTGGQGGETGGGSGGGSGGSGGTGGGGGDSPDGGWAGPS